MPKRLTKVSDDKIFLSWEEYMSQFLRHKKSLKLAPRTIADAKYHIEKLFENKIIDFSDFESLKRTVTDYFADNENIASSTFNTRRKTLNTFFNWMIAEEILDKNPMKGIKKAKEDRKPRHVASAVITKLLNACDRTTYVGLRDYICIALSFDTGIRPSEMEQLLYTDFNFEAYQFTIRAEIAKTRIARTLPLSKKLIPLIQKLYKMREGNEWNDNIPIFANWNGEPLNRWSWRRRLIHYYEKIGIKVTPYMLRHSSAIESLRNGANAFYVQTMLGHLDMNTTKIYVNLVESDLKETHETISPLDKVIQEKRNEVKRITKKKK
jgi:site-specific recombinase XerD